MVSQQRKKVISFNFKGSVAVISIFLDPYLNLKEADFREGRNLLLYIRKVNKEQFVVYNVNIIDFDHCSLRQDNDLFR